ncbi:YugN family protein [Savagea faecisuis]|uniref:YugN family protein n=1 Tax=Savagea faecisuis TaxID=1274803 RepID=A0ABW3GWM4_9BACL
MYIENTGLESLVVDLRLLKEIMHKHDLFVDGQWDYERITFDKKYVIKEGTYYLRVFGYTEDGDIGSGQAEITLKKPALGKHYYPFGVEYGEDEVFPENLVKDCEKTLQQVLEDLKPYVQA